MPPKVRRLSRWAARRIQVPERLEVTLGASSHFRVCTCGRQVHVCGPEVELMVPLPPRPAIVHAAQARGVNKYRGAIKVRALNNRCRCP